MCFVFDNQMFRHAQSAVHRSFAVADNLGEVSAKAQVSFEKKPTQVFYCLYHIHDLILFVNSQIQTVCFDNLGLLLAVLLNMLFQNNQRLVDSIVRIR